jgi:hypothetical protein
MSFLGVYAKEERAEEGVKHGGWSILPECYELSKDLGVGFVRFWGR